MAARTTPLLSLWRRRFLVTQESGVVAAHASG